MKALTKRNKLKPAKWSPDLIQAQKQTRPAHDLLRTCTGKSKPLPPIAERPDEEEKELKVARLLNTMPQKARKGRQVEVMGQKPYSNKRRKTEEPLRSNTNQEREEGYAQSLSKQRRLIASIIIDRPCCKRPPSESPSQQRFKFIRLNPPEHI